jgi:uncharacterized RDD family membrane protein YckC
VSDWTPGYRLGSSRAVLGWALGLAYFVVIEATDGVTLGKRLLGHRVVRLDGTRLGWGRAFLRNVLRPNRRSR